MNKKRIGQLLISIIIIITLSFATSLFLSRSVNKNSEVKNQPLVSAPKPTIASIQTKLLFTGNVYWGRYINDWSMASELKFKYPFSRLDEFKRQDYNAWIGGLECPLVPDLNLTSAQEEGSLSFNCRPEYLPEAKKYFTAFSLSNNHTDNQGADGFETTKQQLKAQQIQYFGHYDPRETTEACEILSIPVSVKFSDSSTKDGRLPMAFCGYHGVFRIPPQESVDEIKKFANLMPTFAFPHMGAEYKPAPDEIKTSLHRSLIDAGADAVIGDHPHWIQNTESYKGKLIVHSMGNFMFDQQFNAEVTRSAAIKLDLSIDQPANIDKWLEIGQQCQTFKDNCLELITASQLEKIPLKWQFDFIGTTNQNRLTRPADAAQTAQIRQRLNWDQTLSQLKY